MRRWRFFVRSVKATNTGRPALVRPMAIMRSSSSECFGSGGMRRAPMNSASISAMETPCFWHFARLPSSQSNPVTREFIIAGEYANVYTNVTQPGCSCYATCVYELFVAQAFHRVQVGGTRGRRSAENHAYQA